MSQEGKIILMILMLQFVIMGAYVAKNDKAMKKDISTNTEMIQILKEEK